VGPEHAPADVTAQVVAALARWPRGRIRLDELVALLVEAQPELAASHDRTERLVALVEVLGADGTLSPTKSVIRRHGADLPSSFRLVDTEAGGATNPALRHPWVPLLAWCADRRWPAPTFEHLVRLNRWLAQRPDELLEVPVRERSLEVLGDDKALGKLLRGSLGTPDVVAALAIHDAHPPMAVDEVAGAAGRGVLVVENGTTFWSALRAARKHAAAGRSVAWRWIGCGAGRQLASLVPSLGALEPDHLAYFGDLDPEGVTIAWEGARAAANHGLPPLQPQATLYRALLDNGIDQHRPGRDPWPTDGLGWLGPSRATEVTDRFGDDAWLSQEWVGLSWLLDNEGWLQPPDGARLH
jgi:hypothetical protein